MEYQVGQEIKTDECSVTVVEHENCDGCLLLNKCKTGGSGEIKSLYGECSYMDRKDGKNVIFVQSSGQASPRQDKSYIHVYSQNTKLFFTSDLHFCHDREFIFKPRGFNSVQEMNNAIVDNWNSIVAPDDTIYVLGDLCLGGPSNPGLEYMKMLNGNIYIVIGNHDTEKRIELYSALPNVKSVMPACYVKYDGYHMFLTHFPCLSGNLHKESLKQVTINLFGHTHSKEKYFYDLPYMYNVAVDAHDNKPVSVVEIINDLNNKVKECKGQI